jgi:hypothetical protein
VAADDADGDGAAAPQTLAQQRRMFFDYARIIDLLAEASSAGAAQQLERAMRDMIAKANIAPSAAVDARRALRTMAALNGYVTLLETVPRSLVAPWTQPTPLTEAEIAAYPEGADVPDEHPPRLAPLLWQAMQHIRRRAAKERRGAPPPKRSLRDALARLFTPPTDDDDEIAARKATDGVAPEIHTVPGPEGASPRDVDPPLTDAFHAPRAYEPQRLRVFLSDIVLVALSRHAFGADALAWLGGLKRDFPHSTWEPVASGHLLAMAVARMPPVPCALLTVRELLAPQWFAPCSRVDCAAMLNDVAAVDAERPLDTGAFRHADVVDAFARRFCGTLLGRNSAGGATTGAAANSLLAIAAARCPALHARVLEIRDAAAGFEKTVRAGGIEPSAAEAAARIEDADERERLAVEAVEATVAADEDASNEWGSAAKRIATWNAAADALVAAHGPALIATPHMLRVAVDCRNVVAVRWLVAQGVAQVEVERGRVAVAEYCVEADIPDVLVALIRGYADASAPVLSGAVSVLAASQRAFAPKVAALVERAYRRAQAERGADPTQQLGVRIGSIA